MHVAIIPDGNRRWSKTNNKSLSEGYEKGAFVAKIIIKEAVALNIKYLTLFILSTENVNRSVEWIKLYTDGFMKHIMAASLEAIESGCKIQFLGNKKILGENVENMILEIEKKEPAVFKMNLNFCFGYSGRADIIQAVEKMISEKADAKDFNQFLLTKNMPDPDLIIRTSGEMRLSNFLLFESAYSELFFVENHWPDFTTEEFKKIIEDFNTRQRRFGK